MAFKASATDLNIEYSSLTDVSGGASANFIVKSDNKHYLSVGGFRDYLIKVTFTQENAGGYWAGKKIIIPNPFGQDIVFTYGADVDTTVTLRSGYDYGPILVDGYPSTSDSQVAYFFKSKTIGDVFLRVNIDSDIDQVVNIRFRQKNEGQSASKISIPVTGSFQPGDKVFDYGKGPDTEYKFLANRTGKIYGPIKVDDKLFAANSLRGITYDLYDDGKEFAVLVGGDDKEDFNLVIENVEIIDQLVNSGKLFYKILSGGQEFAALDGTDDEIDFNIKIKSIDDDPISRLDVYHFGEESGNNNRPVVIGIHAGSWTENQQSKDDFLGSKASYFRQFGYIFVNIDFRESPEPPPNIKGSYLGYAKNRTKFPAHIEDVAKSIKWVNENIGNYGGDPNRILLYGHGSGAHLASLVVTNKKWLNDLGISPSIIKGCIASSNLSWNIKYELDNESTSIVPDTKTTIYNVFGIDPVVGGAESKIDFESPDKAKEAYDFYSPDKNITVDLPKFLILTRGSNDTIKRADDFVSKLSAVGIASTNVTHYKYPENRIYSQSTMQSVLGGIDPPRGFALPKKTISVSDGIFGFLNESIPFPNFPPGAIVEPVTIDGQKYPAVSGISTIIATITPTPTGVGTSASTPSSTASSANNSAKQITVGAGGLFGSPGTDVLRVGYIDPVLGYVTGFSICEANNFAQKNPGTTFVTIDGDNNVNYLNINDVNTLTADFINPTKKCDGLSSVVPCGEPILNINGGGGVGAQANIIIGTDGSVMAVDLVHNGYGYQYPPLVQAIDKCYFGNGATFESFLGEIDNKIDADLDFEDYYVCPPGTSFGTIYDGDGKEIGKWNPSLYTKPSSDPIAKQIDDYQKILNQIKNPFWTTRSKKPSKITGTNSSSLTIYPVSHPCKTVNIEGLPITNLNTTDETWNDFMNKYAVSPVSPSNVPGTDFAATMFTMEWNEVFPYEGEYIFRGCADSIVKDLYIDNLKVGSFANYNEPPNLLKKTITGGVHNIRIDLQNGADLNPPVAQAAVTSVSNTADVDFNVSTKQKSRFASVFRIQDLGIEISKAVNAKLNQTIPTKVEVGKVYTIEIEVPQGISTTTLQIKGKTLILEDLKSSTARDLFVTINKGRFFDVVNGRTKATCKFIVDEPKSTVASTSVVNLNPRQVFSTLDYIDKADRKLWKTNPGTGKDADFLNKYGVSPFDTSANQSQTESYGGVHVIRWSNINFPIDSEYTIDIIVDDNVKLFIGNAASGGNTEDGSGLSDEEILEVRGFSSPGISKGKQSFVKKFKSGNYRIRAELEQISGTALAKGNPMILGIQISTKVNSSSGGAGVSKIISNKSWCENPLGVSLTIEAPPIPIPQEPAITYDQCPPTPLWSTRQPNASKIWYPVKFNGYKIIEEQLSRVPTKEKIITDTQSVEFTVSGEGSKGDKSIKYLEFLFESVDGKESFVLHGVEVDKDKKTSQYRIEKSIKKNLRYKVTARISDTKKAGFTKVEQGLAILKGKSTAEAGKLKNSGQIIFADFVGSSNDNDDIRVSVSKGAGEFTTGKKSSVGGRTNFELFYELQSKDTVGSKVEVKIKPEFIKDKNDGKFYLDMRGFSGEFELDFKFMIGDTIKGKKGLAGSLFEIRGTSIKFGGYKGDDEKNVQKTFKINGGKLYGPLVFTAESSGASTQLLSADQIASLRSKTGKNDIIDFNIILTGISGLEVKTDKKIDGWSKFLNRYAISPIPPLYTPGTDGGGITYENSWDVEFPYDGFYKFEAQADNQGSVFLDGNIVLENFRNFRETISEDKVFVSKGKHNVKVQIENQKTEMYDTLDQKIFSTLDWQTSPKSVSSTADVDFNYKTVASSTLASYFRIPELGIDIFKPTRTGLNQNIPKKVEVGKVYTIEFEAPNTSGSVSIVVRGNTLVVEDLKSRSARDLFLTVNKGRFFDVVNGRTKATCKFIVDGDAGNVSSSNALLGPNLITLPGAIIKNGVTYEGPSLFNYQDKRWSQFMNKYNIVPTDKSVLPLTYNLKWSGVEFPEDGQYEYSLQADNLAIFKIDGKEISKSTQFAELPNKKYFNASKGKHTIEIVLSNTLSAANETFEDNPMGVSLYINKNVNKLSSVGKSWLENPMGIGVVIIPPPCPKPVGGKGIVSKIVPVNPGTGYVAPPTSPVPTGLTIPPALTVPVALVLDDVIIDDPGINCNCGVDEIIITPSNGAVLSYECSPFGKITKINVENPGFGFTEYPTIRLISSTGVNFKARPVFRVIRDPVPVITPEKIIQVTDLVGLTQTGWYDGRPYYGAIFYKDGVKFAGYYETIGEPVQIYDTLQESVDGLITTPPSAIERSGTDINSNNPRLNIPGTPTNLS
jgi:acetyl esterase/lipase